MPPGDASTPLLLPPPPRQAASISCTSNLVALWAQGGSALPRGCGVALSSMPDLSPTCPDMLITDQQCHVLQVAPQMSPPGTATVGAHSTPHLWALVVPMPANTSILSGGFLCLPEAARPSSGSSELSGAPRTNGFQELVSKCPSALIPGWMGVSDTPFCAASWSSQWDGAPGSPLLKVSLPCLPTGVSCHPTPLPPHLGVRFWNTSHPDIPSKAFLAHHICRKLTCSPRKICPYPNPWNLRM